MNTLEILNSMDDGERQELRTKFECALLQAYLLPDQLTRSHIHCINSAPDYAVALLRVGLDQKRYSMAEVDGIFTDIDRRAKELGVSCELTQYRPLFPLLPSSADVNVGAALVEKADPHTAGQWYNKN